jgi:2-keto-4-pentenoate hydratase/2-oxohepta-3-ene-1,7-dioic acid hydratase in catechol pathway
MESQRIRLGTVDDHGAERVVLVRDEDAVFLDENLSGAPSDVRELIADWPRWRHDVLRVAASADGRGGHGALSWRPPVMPQKLLCVGTNYADHVAEMVGPAGISDRPAPFAFSFLKPPSTSLVGSGRPVQRPSYGRLLDWEAELAVIIGDPSAAAGPEPLDAVFGYTILNDLSLRDFIPFPHALGLDAVVSKGFDGAAPMGPWITLADSVGDPQSLPIELRVNGEVMQQSSTAKMIFTVGELVSHYARVLTLEPGDVIATGTPAGVGVAREPPRYLEPGDAIEARIGELGVLETTITAPESDTPLMAEQEEMA